MALNSNIILQGQTPDIVGAMRRGQVAGQEANQFRQQNALNGFLRENGQAVMGGDQNALNSLSELGVMGFDAAQGVKTNALNMQKTQLGMDATQLNMDNATANQGRLDRDEQRQIDEYALSLSAGERAQEADNIRAAVGAGLGAETPEQWDQIVGQNAPDLVGLFDKREAIAGKYLSIADSLKRFDERNAPKVTSYIGMGDPALGMDPNVAYNYKSGPEGMSASPIGGGGSVINNTLNATPEGGVTDDFYKNVDKGQAAMFVGLVNEGVNIPAKLAQIDQLEGLLAQSPSGAEAAFKSFLGNYGIKTDGLSALQASNAIISQLVPAQRPAGSGTMSDADLALFKASLPRLINTPEGNTQIIAAIRGIAVYQQQQGDIANAVISREMTPAEGRTALMGLRNPLEVMRRDGATEVGGGYTIREIK